MVRLLRNALRRTCGIARGRGEREMNILILQGLCTFFAILSVLILCEGVGYLAFPLSATATVSGIFVLVRSPKNAWAIRVPALILLGINIGLFYCFPVLGYLLGL